MCSLYKLPVAKNHNFGQILTLLGAPVPTPFYRWGPNLVGWSRPKVYTYPPNFIWMCSLCRLPVAKNHNFWQILTFWGLLYWPPFTDEGHIWCATSGPRSTLTCQISPECVHCVGFRGQKPQFWANFDILEAPVPIPFYRWGQIWCARSDPRSTLTSQISSEYVHCVGFRSAVAKNHNFRQIVTFLGAPVLTPFYRWGPNLVSYSRPTVYVYLPNFVSNGLFCRPAAAETPNVCRFLDFGI